jgi:tetratricopeptide (TPR) repeat protein
MDDWIIFADKAANIDKETVAMPAQDNGHQGEENCLQHAYQLTQAADACRASGDSLKSLDYSELLISQYPDLWFGYGLAAEDLMALGRPEEAQNVIAKGLEKFPNQINLLTTASDVYRASGDLTTSLDYAELLTNHHPDQWLGYQRTAQNLVALKRIEQAQEITQRGLERFPTQSDLLTIAVDAYRASGDRETSLEYSQRLMIHDPDNWLGFGRATEDLLALQRIEEAQATIQKGLRQLPDHAYLLMFATDASRAMGDFQTALDYSKRLILHHPDQWFGFGRAAEDLIALKRAEEAQATIKEGLRKFPHQFNLLSTAMDVYRASGDRPRSLEHSELMIVHHPDHWLGYGRAAESLAALKRLQEAQAAIKRALEKFPSQPEILSIASDVYRASGEHLKSLDIATQLIRLHPENWLGYKRVAEDLTALKRFAELRRFSEQASQQTAHINADLIEDWKLTSASGAQALADMRSDGSQARVRAFSDGRTILVPVGDFCLGAQLAQDTGRRPHALPFDWLYAEPPVIEEIIRSDFRDFLTREYLQSRYPVPQCGHSIYNKEIDLFNHHDPSREPDRAAFLRRVQRFKDLLSQRSTEILFFNVRLTPEVEDLSSLLKVLPADSRILSFVFLGGGTAKQPTAKAIGSQILQFTFTCDDTNTHFAKTTNLASSFTDGRQLYCPYSNTYARGLLEALLERP